MKLFICRKIVMKAVMLLNRKTFLVTLILMMAITSITLSALDLSCRRDLSVTTMENEDHISRIEYILFQDKEKIAKLNVTGINNTNKTMTTQKTPRSVVKALESKENGTRPPWYPENGTGVTVSIAKHFNQSIFSTFCKNLKLTIIIPVYSSPNNFENRAAIRQTYAKTCKALLQKCKVFFITGIDLNNSTLERLKNEYVIEKDILVIDKVDTYRDLNNKAAAMVNWLDQNCSSAKYVLRVMDNVYPNIALFLKVLGSVQESSYILGVPLKGQSPLRGGTWKVSREEYPFNAYPDYVSALVYAFPSTVTKLLRPALHTAKYCWIEDVWLTGLVREKVGVKVTGLSVGFKDHPDRNANFSKTIFYNKVKPQDFYYFYNVSNSEA